MNKQGKKTFFKTKAGYGYPICSNFTKPFMVECNALKIGVRVVLMQEWKHIAYLSKGLKGKEFSLSIYEKKKLLTLVMIVQKWRLYLLSCTFKVKTNQQSLKYLLEQKIGTPQQQKWVLKLLGCDFVVE